MENERGGIRLQKFLAAAGIASRRKCEEIIAGGRVSVNGSVVTETGVRVQSGDAVLLDGNPVAPEEQTVYIAFNKPPFVVTTASDPEGRKTALEYFKQLDVRVYPVGRLDFETEGLLLLTNDGEWANRVTHPSFNLEKEYLVRVSGTLDDAQIRALETGVILEGKRTWPAKVAYVKHDGAATQLHVTIHEGRNRQVRRMLEAVGSKAVYLKRVRIGNVLLGDLKAGQWRHLSRDEADGLGGDQTAT